MADDAPERPRRVLITCRTLRRHSGSEAYARDLAIGLLRRGHHPIVYSADWGEFADDLLRSSVAVVDDLARIAVPPDIIHANHHPEALAALLHFPRTPAVLVCHAWQSDEARPLLFPRVRRYLAVDDTCAERLIDREGIAPEAVTVLRNAVDLERFPRRAPLPERPRRALLLSSSGGDGDFVELVAAACREHGIPLEIQGAGVGRPCPRPESLLPDFDLVFAKARCALEAMAVGCAVVLCDWIGMGPMVTRAEVERLWRRNFGFRILQQRMTAPALLAEIERYDPADASRVSRWVRENADLDRAVTTTLELYETVLAEFATAPALWPDEMRAAAAYLQSEAPRWDEIANLRRHLELTTAAARAEAEAQRARAEIAERYARSLEDERQRRG